MNNRRTVLWGILSVALILSASSAIADPETVLPIKWRAFLNQGSFQCKYTQEEESDAMKIRRTGSIEWQLPKFKLTEETLTKHSGGAEERIFDVFVYDGTRFMRFSNNEVLTLSKREEALPLFRFNNNPLTFLFDFLHDKSGRSLPFSAYRKEETYLNLLKKLEEIQPPAEGRGLRFKAIVEGDAYEVELDREFIPHRWTRQFADTNGQLVNEFRVLDHAPAKIHSGDVVNFPSRYELVHRRNGKVIQTTTGTISDVRIGETIPENQFSIDMATVKTVIDIDDGIQFDTK